MSSLTPSAPASPTPAPSFAKTPLAQHVLAFIHGDNSADGPMLYRLGLVDSRDCLTRAGLRLITAK